MSNREYNQVYYTWVPSEALYYSDRPGIGVAAATFPKLSNEIKSANKECEGKKQTLSEYGIIDEYFEYSSAFGKYIYTGSSKMNSLRESANRDNWLVQLFVPKTDDEKNPSNYLRKINYCKITDLKELEGNYELPSVFVEEYFNEGSYQELLEKYKLNRKEQLAYFLYREFQGFFRIDQRKIIFPLDKSQLEKSSEIALEITWLFHSLIPDCLNKTDVNLSQSRLRQQLGYVIKNKADKMCLCFVPRENVEDVASVFDLEKTYGIDDLDKKGKELFLFLAEKALISPEEMLKSLREICEYVQELKYLTHLYKGFENYQNVCWIDNIKPQELPSWAEFNMDEKIKNSMERKSCLKYLKKAIDPDCTQLINDENFDVVWNCVIFKSGEIQEDAKELIVPYLEYIFQSVCKNYEKVEQYKKYLKTINKNIDTLEEIYKSIIKKHLLLLVELKDIAVLKDCFKGYEALYSVKDSCIIKDTLTQIEELARLPIEWEKQKELINVIQSSQFFKTEDLQKIWKTLFSSMDSVDIDKINELLDIVKNENVQEILLTEQIQNVEKNEVDDAKGAIKVFALYKRIKGTLDNSEIVKYFEENEICKLAGRFPIEYLITIEGNAGNKLWKEMSVNDMDYIYEQADLYNRLIKVENSRAELLKFYFGYVKEEPEKVVSLQTVCGLYKEDNVYDFKVVEEVLECLLEKISNTLKDDCFSIRCKSYLQIVKRKKDYQEIYEQLKNKKLLEIMEQVFSKDTDQVWSKVISYKRAKEFLKNPNLLLNSGDLEKYVSAYDGLSSGEEKTKFRNPLIEKAKELYEIEEENRDYINKAMKKFPEWKDYLNSKNKGITLEEFIKKGPEIAKNSPKDFRKEVKKHKNTLIAFYDTLYAECPELFEIEKKEKEEPKIVFESCHNEFGNSSDKLKKSTKDFEKTSKLKIALSEIIKHYNM